MLIEGANNPGNKLHVNDKGQAQARAVSLSEQTSSAIAGDTFNLNTDELTVAVDTEIPLFQFKNVSEENALIVSRIFIVFLASTGGTGPVRASIERDVDGGTLLSQSLTLPENFNFGSSNISGTEFRIGDGTALTFTGGVKVPKFLFTGDSQRHVIPFDAIILPRGASMVLAFTPPAGNTSMIVEAGANFYIGGTP